MNKEQCAGVLLLLLWGQSGQDFVYHAPHSG